MKESGSGNYDLHRKGSIDQARHNEKVKEAIKGNLGNIISEEAIITSDGDKIVKIPIRSLDLPHFMFDRKKDKQIGQGDGNSNIGDVIAQDPDKSGAPNRGKRAGELPGIDYYEAELTIDELSQMIFEDLRLPRLKQKTHEDIKMQGISFEDIRKKGIMSNLDKRRTILENIKRNALFGKPEVKAFQMDDLRFKTWKPVFERKSNAAVLAIRDVSGSMGEFEKYITRSFYFWMARFLRSKYDNVKINFITHHTEAKEVDEQSFFNLGESGGTKVSSAYKLALDMIKERYDPNKWNNYIYHFSDGDNWGDSDNKLCLDLVRKLLLVSNAFGYGEIRADSYKDESTLISTFKALKNESGFMSAIIRDKKDVYPTLRKFFESKGEDVEGALARS